MSRQICIILADQRVIAVAQPRRSRQLDETIVSEAPAAIPDSLLVPHDPQALADIVGSAVDNLGVDSPIAASLVIPLQWCFVQCLELREKSARSREAHCYALEPFLPVAAETVTCEFAAVSSNRILGLALPTEPMASLLQALSQRRIEIERIVPDAVAATCGSHGAMTSGAIFDDRWMRALAVTTDGALLSATLPRSEGNLDHLLARARARLEASGATVEPLALALDLRKVDSERVASVEEHVGETTIYRGRRAVELLAAAAIGSSIDLRTGALVSNRRRERSHRLAAHCLGAAATILVVATIGFSLRGKAFERHLSGVHARQLETYQTIDSGASTLPMGASLRLASERVRLEGLTRGAQDDTASSDGSSALELLREIAASLPTDAPIMLTSARLEAGQFVLRGQTSEHRQAERIAEAIGKVADLEVKPPRTTRLAEGGVEFSLTAEVRK